MGDQWKGERERRLVTIPLSQEPNGRRSEGPTRGWDAGIVIDEGEGQYIISEIRYIAYDSPTSPEANCDHQSSGNDRRRRSSRVGSAVNHRSFRPVPPRKSCRRFKYRPSRRNGVPQRAPGRLYAVPRAAAVTGGGWKMPVATGIARCRLGPVEEGDEPASELRIRSTPADLGRRAIALSA